MRIRKRQVPLPLSSISPVPLSSDPNFYRSPPPVVQLPLHNHPPSLPTPQYCGPSDDHPDNHPIGRLPTTQGRDSSAFHETTTKTHEQELGKKGNDSALKQGEEEDEEKRGEGEKSNDTRKKNVVGAELGTGSNPQSGSSHQTVTRWGEGEKSLIPLKKRRGSFERKSEIGNDYNDDTIMVDQKDSDNNKMKSKMRKKFAQQEKEQEEKESKLDSVTAVDNKNNNDSGGAKKRGRGGALMEGSRCSRVNGRGWRCCQQTLVGYSLCEHHLGKGRLRSMTSVRSRSLAGNNAAAKEEEEEKKKKKKLNVHEYLILSNDSHSSSSKQTKRELLIAENGEFEEGKDEKPLMMKTKKRVKLGMVKARSISSLLGQNDNATTAVVNDNN